ncbi:DUF2938 family protein [Thalassobius sp. MITS945101]|uniref:DUF2938 family protein n=1 Tax=Thalassobius sp. MITS945101 TaxID=3096994 RepID=UPI00399A5404
MEWITAGVALGLGATVFMDLWEWGEARACGWPRRDYALLGRWVLRMRLGVFSYGMAGGIGAAPVQQGEAALGQVLHYLVGAVFGITFLALVGPGWLAAPTMGAAWGFGAVTVLMPFAAMQPAFGLGFAAARTPKPGFARLRSLIGHVSFGLGLWIAAALWHVLM